MGARFSTPVQTSPGAHPASYTVSTGSFLGVKWPGCGVDHSLPSSAEVKEREALYFFSTSGTLWPVIGLFFYYLIMNYVSIYAILTRKN
jgi:hypothetical protein